MDVHSAAIAARFLAIAAEEGGGITNLKLQKLVTLAQSLNLFRHGSRLFVEDVQAWKNGPAIKPLYGMYKRFKQSPISAIDDSWKSREDIDKSSVAVIDEVWRVAGDLSASELWKLTHESGPWKDRYLPDVSDIVIPIEDLSNAWPAYKHRAQTMSGKAPAAPSAVDFSTVEVSASDAALTPVVGYGQHGFKDFDEYKRARSLLLGHVSRES
ncbi:hypothetical protein GCM10022239_10270 [Leifsonia bigeumensis]|uniref:Antitoxin SocA-like Panacea domain-containing protein n=1 Tax=Leifsonella bigeumensis TaxID=433643 RepID=A0ABP7FCU4_9MICO